MASTPLKRVAGTLAGLLDMQSDPEYRGLLVRTDPETGEDIPVTSVIPRSAEDLVARRRAFELWTRKTFGVMGRTPDYMNAFLAALSGCADAFAADGGDRFRQQHPQLCALCAEE